VVKTKLTPQDRAAIFAIAENHGVTSVRGFGSFARGEACPESDLDLLIERGASRTPFFPGGFVADIEALLHRRVDVATESSLPQLLRPRILNQAIPL
jgi:hypothetical protein